MILTLMIEPNKKPMRYYAEPTEDSLCRAVSIGYEDIHDIKIKHMEDDVYTTGENPGKGIYKCLHCGQLVKLDYNTDTLPPCPKCGKTTFYKVG